MTMEAGISGFHKIGITRNKNQKSFTTVTIKPSIPICLRKNRTMN